MSADVESEKSTSKDMDELLVALETDVGISKELDNGLNEHPRYAQYKNYGNLADNQRKRRTEWILRQREDRQELMNKKRNIKNNNTDLMEAESMQQTQSLQVSDSDMSFKNVEVDVDFDSSDEQKIDIRQPFNQYGRKSQRPDLAGMLMYSEWLIDVPLDMEEKWCMVPAPRGKRGLLVLSKKSAKIYNKIGELLIQIECPCTNLSQLMLDVIFDRYKKIIYILDLVQSDICAANNSDFEFRRFMLKNYMESLEVINKLASHTFYLQPVLNCNKEDMTDFMSKQLQYRLDGLMFYHKEAYYVHGETPLVCWLKPWMMKDILGISVHERYLKHPRKTQTQQEYIERFAKFHPTYAYAKSNRMDATEDISEVKNDDEESSTQN